MAGRNQSENADYFSHDADASADEKIIYLESKFGLTGYAVYFKFLESMSRSDGFKIQWNDVKKSVYASKFGISVTEIEQIVTECCRQEIKAFIFDDGMLFSPGLIKRFEPLISKREYNRQKYLEQKQSVGISVTEKGISVNGNQQERKGKERKEKNFSNEISTFCKNFIQWAEKEHGPLASKYSGSLLSKSCDAIDKLIRIDGFSLDYIQAVFRWAIKDSFWSEQIRSLAAVRKQMPNGLMKFQNMATKFEKSNKPSPQAHQPDELKKHVPDSEKEFHYDIPI